MSLPKFKIESSQYLGHSIDRIEKGDGSMFWVTDRRMSADLRNSGSGRHYWVLNGTYKTESSIKRAIDRYRESLNNTPNLDAVNAYHQGQRQ